ncbi:uncharacterized protein LOC124172039 isoform X1 [Ischnura elegans]|uniref:uncharacterized protein LOC124172039 isoform X1 n=1 Tax=Ischnura elegans TaxID=197161 RepID=UPI001ED89938|nr:uncharacterized protein LOC124172039 isoform X1 [Ischnura elegans]
MSYCSENMSITIGDFSESSESNSEGTPCRLCMKKYDYYYYNIFTSTVASQITVKDALYDLVGLKVAVGDGLPGTLCALCLEKLIEFNDFRNICHKSDAELRKISCGIYFRSFLGEGAVHDNLRSSTETKDYVRDAIVSTSEVVGSVQPNEIFILAPDIQLPTANMLCQVQVENKESQREENNQMLHGTTPDGIESDAIDLLATFDNLCHLQVENKESQRKENNQMLHGTTPDGIESDAIDPLTTNNLPISNENGEFIENLAMAVESTAEASVLPAPERSQRKASSASYPLALRDVRTDQSYGRLPPSNTVTLIQSESGAYHTEEGRNVIDKDLEKCGAFLDDMLKL